jgi:hypothetical protein
MPRVGYAAMTDPSSQVHSDSELMKQVDSLVMVLVA